MRIVLRNKMEKVTVKGDDGNERTEEYQRADYTVYGDDGRDITDDIRQGLFSIDIAVRAGKGVQAALCFHQVDFDTEALKENVAALLKPPDYKPEPGNPMIAFADVTTLDPPGGFRQYAKKVRPR